MNDLLDFSSLESGGFGGDAVDRLLNAGGDIGVLRPYSYYPGGPSFITINATDPEKAREYRVSNTTSTLLYDEWKEFDSRIIKAARQRLGFWNDIRGVSTVRLPKGLGTTVYNWQRATASQPATQSMDGMKEGPNDRLESELVSLPIPILHKDFSFSLREIETARRGGMPLDTSMGEESSRKVMELMENICWGTTTGTTYAGATVYGAMTYGDRNTKVLTAPTGSNGGTTITEVLDMKKKLQDDGFYGPYKLYCSTNWSPYLDNDFSTTKGDNTLRERLKKIGGIGEISEADFLVDSTKFVMILIQMTSTVVSAVMAENLRVVQWDSHGGFRKHFKVLMAGAPRFNSDINGACGFCHGSN